mmetsp:Transcript_3767/g.5048  ORF Transcript_3767/g.5048 Transcript_3767/m.5048 type:complete len:609 (-) Transcript_3767:738-2564(-)
MRCFSLLPVCSNIACWLFILLLFCGVQESDACTMLAAGRGTTSDGSTIVTHADDGGGSSDPRLAYVPARIHEKGSLRPVWPDLEDFPRYVGYDRGSTYFPRGKLLKRMTQPIGFIPQVEETYSYMEANYGIQNEHQVMIGESTASSAFKAKPVNANGTALFCVNELSAIAMERSMNAREAIRTMGSLAEKYGFYGADGGAGEALMVGDPHEVFVFHILSDPSKKSAIWVAQRVPDDEVAVVANMFTIREVNLSDTRNFLGSTNMHSVALSHGLWDGKGLLDFTLSFSKGEYGHKYYSGRRVWEAFRILNPSLGLSPEYPDLRVARPYPFSVKPDRQLNVTDFFKIHRSHYEGTKFDTTKGLAAGAFNTPDRYATIDMPGDTGKGSWERTISMYRTTFTWVVQARHWLPDAVGGTIFFGLCDASKTVFVPFMVGAMQNVPLPFRVGSPGEFVYMNDRATAGRDISAYWAFRYIQNIAQLKYAYMIKDINSVQARLETRAFELQRELTNQYVTVRNMLLGQNVNDKTFNAGLLRVRKRIERELFEHAQLVVKAMRFLFDRLMLKYADGGITYANPDGTVNSKDTGYDHEWLENVGFSNGPERRGPPAKPI